MFLGSAAGKCPRRRSPSAPRSSVALGFRSFEHRIGSGGNWWLFFHFLIKTEIFFCNNPLVSCKFWIPLRFARWGAVEGLNSLQTRVTEWPVACDVSKALCEVRELQSHDADPLPGTAFCFCTGLQQWCIASHFFCIHSWFWIPTLVRSCWSHLHHSIHPWYPLVI